MLYHHYCNFRHNTDLFDFFVYVLKVVTQYSYFNDQNIFTKTFTAKNLAYSTQPF